MTADFLVRMAPRNEKTLNFMKPAIRQLLVAMDFLHSECHIIHTGYMFTTFLEDLELQT